MCRRLSSVLVVAWVLLSSSAAHADPVFFHGPPDVGDHSWCTGDNYSHPGVAASSATNLEGWTVVDTEPKDECGEHTDVRWTNGATAGAYGTAECVLWWGNGRCDRYRITINNGVINDEPNPGAQRTKTSCHELGHYVDGWVMWPAGGFPVLGVALGRVPAT